MLFVSCVLRAQITATLVNGRAIDNRQSRPGPVEAGLPSPWAYAGCYVDNAHDGVLELEVGSSPTNTVQSCIQSCQEQDFSIAGVEFASECYCGDMLIDGTSLADEATCNMACSGDASEACGGPNRLSVYSSTTDIVVDPVPTPQTTDLPGQWQYAGCFTDTADRVLKRQIIYPDNSPDKCASQCSAFGYSAAGMEFGQECYCGDIEDIAANGGEQADEGDCNMACPGDPVHLCGGGNRLQMYNWDGQLHVWHTPTNTGRYEFFVPGVVVPLIATLGINNKVTFLEKHGTGFPNSTGAYELDLSLADDFSRTWREMHVKTDVFCSGSFILPDRGGRQINVGGWSVDSLSGVRLYTPDGVEGTNSTNDWEEDVSVLALQRPRWYPTAALLPNGSIIVMGGEIGSNGPPQPNLEVLPRPEGGDTVVNLDFLERTDPWSLYPFIVVLPSGRLFVSYYNEARILDAQTFGIVQELPNIPGVVSNDLGGRTYPLEGAAVVFPQSAPYTDPLRVLLCGGSTGPGPAITIDNCVSIAPEEENPTWTLERMPSRRVMSCMVPLPDGTFMIMNGALEGVAGFGLASDPNLNAVLYDPSQPVNERMSILGSTIVPRMYHSEAILLYDGSILVSGSDPQTPGLPEEFRIERYIPPYLSDGRRQPGFTAQDTDWAYGGTYTISNVQLFQGGQMRVSLVYATSSTHGNTMGARTIFPAFSCAGAICTITAPPNANVSPPGWHQLFILDGPTPSHSTWVRIGGDPAGLGNWPDLPGFTRPGV